MTSVGYGSSGCGTDPVPPSYISCSCVSRREYVCVIGTVTRAMNGDVWFCLTPGGNIRDDIGITSVSMVFPAVSPVSVIEHTAQQFRCETSAGNPQAIMEWYKDNGTPDMTDDTEIISGKETNTSASGTLSVTIGKLTLTVQRNDHEVGVYCRANNGGAWLYSLNGSEVTSPLRVIFGRSMTLICSSMGNPSPTYTWTYHGRGSQSGLTLTLVSVQTRHAGTVTCTARNKLTPSGATAVDKTQSTTINLQVLYSPSSPSCTISGKFISTTAILVEGTDRIISCTSYANPPLVTYIWSTPSGGQVSGANLSLTNVKHPADHGQYTLTVTNTMDPTEENTETGTNSTAFSSSVTEFRVTGNRHEANVTETDKGSTTFTCMVDSNPPSTIKIKKDGELRKSVDHSKELEYTIANLACTDAGLYTCGGSNQFNFDKPSAKELHMFVTCSPRRPPGQDIKLNFTARLHDNYTVVAYPVPIASQFVWKRCFGRNICVQLSNIPAKYEITTMDLSSNLTIVDTDIDDFGVYSLSVSNGIGEEIVEDIFLQSVDPPDTPSWFMVISNTVTSSSAVLSWIPGPNNGSPQTFQISYRVLNTLADWLDVSVQHNGETEMNVTLISLDPGRSYFAKCYAMNIAGDSGKQILTFSTLKEVAHAESHVAVIAGGVTAGVITMVVIVVVFCVLRNQYSCAFKVTRKEDSRSRPTVPFAEITGDNDAVTYETVSAKNNTPVYDDLGVGNEGGSHLPQHDGEEPSADSALSEKSEFHV
ncbi:CONT-like protein [Mya arenaria]|uniref:CONT-like protein n=1 Tax=Mya arenaria TaxID=6604 RepID=A0ABY7E974_MYAAR|nr:CONT-like protein [Mya arenaria]